jgi:hypothetical protein
MRPVRQPGKLLGQVPADHRRGVGRCTPTLAATSTTLVVGARSFLDA